MSLEYLGYSKQFNGFGCAAHAWTEPHALRRRIPATTAHAGPGLAQQKALAGKLPGQGLEYIKPHTGKGGLSEPQGIGPALRMLPFWQALRAVPCPITERRSFVECQPAASRLARS